MKKTKEKNKARAKESRREEKIIEFERMKEDNELNFNRKCLEMKKKKDCLLK